MKNNILLLLILLLHNSVCLSQKLSQFTDERDSYEYRIIQIGNQWWMAENLRFIPEVFPVFSNQGIYVYNYSGNSVDSAIQSSEYQSYGCLYNWEQAAQLCPSGWHLPSDQEWKQLEKTLGMKQSQLDSLNWRDSGEVGMKISKTDHFSCENSALSVQDFNALPGGISFSTSFMEDTIFGLEHEMANFWTSTIENDGKAWARGISLMLHPGIGRTSLPLFFGLSVRCIRD